MFEKGCLKSVKTTPPGGLRHTRHNISEHRVRMRPQSARILPLHTAWASSHNRGCTSSTPRRTASHCMIWPLMVSFAAVRVFVVHSNTATAMRFSLSVARALCNTVSTSRLKSASISRPNSLCLASCFNHS